MLVLSVRFVVSTTSSSPSQCARESPRYCLDAGRHVRPAVRVEETRVVDHLVADRHHAGRLDDPVAVAVDDSHHRSDDAARDAAVVEREVLGRIERSVAESALIARGAALLCFRGEGRRSAVRRIDNQRSLAEGASSEVAAEGADGVLGVRDAALNLLLSRREFLVVLIQAVAEILWPRHRHRCVVAAPDALQIRIAPRCLRHRVGQRRATVVRRDDQCRCAALTGHRQRRHCHERHRACCTEGRQNSTTHQQSPFASVDLTAPDRLRPVRRLHVHLPGRLVLLRQRPLGPLHWLAGCRPERDDAGARHLA